MQARRGVLILTAGSDLVGRRNVGKSKRTMYCAVYKTYVHYFPNRAAFDEGGYEARTSSYTAGVSEAIINCGKEILKELKG